MIQSDWLFRLCSFTSIAGTLLNLKKVGNCKVRHVFDNSKFLEMIVRIKRPMGTHSANLTESEKVANSAAVSANGPCGALVKDDGGAWTHNASNRTFWPPVAA